MRRTVPLVIAFVAGVILLTQYFVPSFYPIYEIALEWSPVIAGITAFLGIASFLMHHWSKTKRKTQDWRFSLAALVAFFAMVVAGLWGELFDPEPADVPPTWPKFEVVDVPDDAGGQMVLGWQLENRVGDIRAFEVHRKAADEGDDAYVLLREFKGDENGIGRPIVNRENHGRDQPSLVANGDFEDGLAGFSQEDGAKTEDDPEHYFHGSFAVLPAGSSVATPEYTLSKDSRYRLSAVARSRAGAGSLTVEVILADGTVYRTYEVAFSNDEWVEAIGPGLSDHVLPPADADLKAGVRFTAVGTEVLLDEIAFRPVQVEFTLAAFDSAAFNNESEFPHHGEMAELLTTHNPTFDANLLQWTTESAERVERTDKEGKFCARIPQGGTLTSKDVVRIEDPDDQKLGYRFRGWGRGAEAGLKGEIVALDADGAELATAEVEWPAGTDWEIKELEIAPPEKTAAFLLRFTAPGSGYAEVDDMTFLPFKTLPVAGVEYVYKVVAKNAAGPEGVILGETVSEPVAGEHELIGSWKSPYGVYRWLFNYVLVPMEATMFALLAFYIASAAFRAFRARSLEATLLLVAAIFVMIGRVPIGDYIWEPLGDIADWIMQYPNGAAKRAIMMGVGLGMAATSLKLMLGIERAYLGKG